MANMRGCAQSMLSFRGRTLSLSKISNFGKTCSGLLNDNARMQHCPGCLHLQLSQQHVSRCQWKQKPTLLDLKNLIWRPDVIKSQRPYSSKQGSLVHQDKWVDKAQNFVESENEYFHSYLESDAEYQPYLLSYVSIRRDSVLPKEMVLKLLQEVKEGKKVENLLVLLEHWSSVTNVERRSVLSEKLFCQTVKLLQTHIKQLSTEEVLQSMAHLNCLNFRQNAFTSEPRRNRIIVSKSFDQACIQHIEEMGIKELLLAADFFYSVRGSSFTQFPYLMCERMRSSLPSLSKSELILLLFHIGLTRRAPVDFIGPALSCLKQHMKSLTFQELAIINLAHYKTQTLVTQPEYFMAFACRLKCQNDLDPICLSALMKYQHRSLNRRKDQILPQFFTTVKELETPLRQRIANLPSETLMHVLNLYYSMELLSEDLFMTIVDQIRERGVQAWRVKDIAKVTQVLTNIPLGAENKMEALAAILAELQRKERQRERNDHPACLLQIAVSLSFCSIYPHWLVEDIFGDVSQKKFKGSKINYRPDLYHLSESITIEDQTYNGPLLWADNFPKLNKDKVYSKLMQTNGESKKSNHVLKLMDRSETSGGRLFNRDRILLDLMDILSQIYPQVSPLPCYLLSHFHMPDVEVQHLHGSDQDTEAISQEVRHTNGKFVSEAVVLHASNAYQRVPCRDGNTVLLLRQYHAMRARQLRKLGAFVVEIPHFEFEASKDKGQYLLTKFIEEKER